MSGLPNWHPALVHFPIALFVSAVAFDLGFHLGANRFKSDWLEPGALLLYVASSIMAIAASIAGQLGANHLLRDADRGLIAAVGEHSDWAFLTTVLFVGLTVYRLDARARRPARSPSQDLLRSRLGLLAAALVLACLWQTASRGGHLVYRLGLGVAEDSLGSRPH